MTAMPPRNLRAEPSGASISATISRFYASVHRRRVAAIIANFGDDLSPDKVTIYLLRGSSVTTKHDR